MAHPEPAPPAPSPLRATIHAHREVAAAVLILLGVLAVLDVFAIGEPRLLLSLGPLVFLLVAALFRLTPTHVAACVGGFAGVALTSGDARYAGLAYPAAAVTALLLLHRVRRGGP